MIFIQSYIEVHRQLEQGATSGRPATLRLSGRSSVPPVHELKCPPGGQTVTLYGCCCHQCVIHLSFAYPMSLLHDDYNTL